MGFGERQRTCPSSSQQPSGRCGVPTGSPTRHTRHCYGFGERDSPLASCSDHELSCQSFKNSCNALPHESAAHSLFLARPTPDLVHHRRRFRIGKRPCKVAAEMALPVRRLARLASGKAAWRPPPSPEGGIAAASVGSTLAVSAMLTNFALKSSILLGFRQRTGQHLPWMSLVGLKRRAHLSVGQLFLKTGRLSS
jgi:hypothetical protein